MLLIHDKLENPNPPTRFHGLGAIFFADSTRIALLAKKHGESDNEVADLYSNRGNPGNWRGHRERERKTNNAFDMSKIIAWNEEAINLRVCCESNMDERFPISR